MRKSRWPPWATRPNEPSGFHGRKELLNRASAVVTTCPKICQVTSEDTKQHFIQPLLRVQELCESRGDRPGLPVLMSLTVSVDVKQH